MLFMRKHDAQEFEVFIQNFLITMGFDVQLLDAGSEQDAPPDFTVKRDSMKGLVEAKFYRSSRVGEMILRTSAVLLQHFQCIDCHFRIAIVSAYVQTGIKKAIFKDTGVVIWDRSNIVRFQAACSRDDLNEMFGRMLLESQQGVDVEAPFAYVDENVSDRIEDYLINPSSIKESKAIEFKGRELAESIASIPAGKEGWYSFEKKCLEILKYLFSDDLSLWDTQKRTDEGLDRFDLLCRISSADDFWRTLIDSFRSRFVVFEYKNYAEPIDPGLIYTTERYLYPNALRSVAIIIARNGYKDQTLKAAKGALRESGKLILLITQTNIIEMLEAKDVGDSPNDIFSKLLDEFLSSISR
jgi:hypothetical protein